MRKITALLASLAAGLVALVASGSGLADTTTFGGQFTSTDCGTAHTFAAGEAASVRLSLSLSDKHAAVIIEVRSSKDELVARGHGYPDSSFFTFDVVTPGSYVFRVCPEQRAEDDPPVYYTGTLTTAPASPAQNPGAKPPATIGAVAGVSTTLKRSASGWGAIKTRHGLAWFWVRASNSGNVRVHFDDNAQKLHLRATNLGVVFGEKTVTISGNGMRLVLVDGARDRVSLRTPKYSAGGTVVRGGLAVH